MTTVARIMIAPTERSMPAVRMISVWAMPSVPMIVTCCRISDRLKGAKNRGRRATLKTRTPSSSTMNGTAVG